jgi:hypothetical protein
MVIAACLLKKTHEQFYINGAIKGTGKEQFITARQKMTERNNTTSILLPVTQ